MRSRIARFALSILFYARARFGRTPPLAARRRLRRRRFSRPLGPF